MSEPLKPLYELMREWPHDQDLIRDGHLQHDSGVYQHSHKCKRCQLEAQLRAWDEQLASELAVSSDRGYCAGLESARRLLGVPPK